LLGHRSTGRLSARNCWNTRFLRRQLETRATAELHLRPRAKSAVLLGLREWALSLGISLSALVVPPDGLDPMGKLDYEGEMIWKWQWPVEMMPTPSPQDTSSDRSFSCCRSTR